jgi:hypothetical protein
MSLSGKLLVGWGYNLMGTLSNAADQDISSGALLQPNKKFKMQDDKSTIQAAPMVGFDAMTRAKSTLEDFVCFWSLLALKCITVNLQHFHTVFHLRYCNACFYKTTETA